MEITNTGGTSERLIRTGNERLVGPAPEGDGRTVVLIAPYEEVTEAQFRALLGIAPDASFDDLDTEGLKAKGFVLESLDPADRVAPVAEEAAEAAPVDPSMVQGHRDELAAQRLDDIEKSTDPAKVAAEADALAQVGEHPTAEDVEHAEQARNLEEAVDARGADSGAEVADVDAENAAEGKRPRAPKK